MSLRDRILATRAEAERRLALAEAAARHDEWPDLMEVLGNGQNAEDDTYAHIAANDPTTVAAEQRRIIAACDADLALLDRMDRLSGHLDVPTTPEWVAFCIACVDDRYPEEAA